ncbi:MAG: hypothetical protein H8D23_02600 [Candidatus Brocadiales bacterium]|nr:hypothetical protein [Candidatus Brocadiales bacterium]
MKKVIAFNMIIVVTMLSIISSCGDDGDKAKDDIFTSCDENLNATLYNDIGDGTEAKPYIICTKEQVKDLENISILDGGYDSYFKLMNNIDMTGVTTSEIGYFSGSFDGNNNTITNLTISRSVSETFDNFGFIGRLSEEGIVKNLCLIDISVTLEVSLGVIGGIVGENNGTIDNSCVSGNINGVGIVYIGGLVGQNDGTIKNSYSTANVTGTARDVTCSESLVLLSLIEMGGLVGSNNGVIMDSYSTGYVSNPNEQAACGRTLHIGGFAGENRNSIVRSYPPVSGNRAV